MDSFIYFMGVLFILLCLCLLAAMGMMYLTGKKMDRDYERNRQDLRRVADYKWEDHPSVW